MTDAPAQRLDPSPFAADAGLALVWAALPEARVIGGAVRDALLGQAAADIDLATPLPPGTVLAALAAAGLGAKPTGLAHGTITAVALGRGYQVTTLRHDLATDGRRAVVAFTADWRADAARRDFTFNALSLDRAGGVHDYWGGIADLGAGRVRFVGDPAARIAEDYLRILRFFRFQARFGRLAPDAATLAALRAGVAGLARLSAERVRQELVGLLASPDPMPALATMAATGVLAAVLPHGTDLALLGRLVAAGAPADPLLRLAALAGADPGLAERLRLSRAEARHLAALRAPPPPAGADAAALRRALATLDPGLPAAVLAGQTWLASDDPPARSAQLAALAGMARPAFPLAGRDAQRLGVAPGPEIGRRLDAVRRWWLEGGCMADRAACLERLRAGLSDP